MKKILTILSVVVLTASVFAQTPQKMSYQAVIRDANDNLVSNAQVGMQISILQSATSGTAVYVETHTPTTNANGLVSIEIGSGVVVSGDFTTINWANDTYFIKTETDLEGGTTYSITGISQLLSVPYALHAKTAENVTGGISETDPAVAANFDFTDAANGDLLQFNGTKWVKVTPTYISDYTVTENDVTAHQAALSITKSQISDLGPYSGIETDPTVAANFDFTDAANGDLLQFNGTKWVKVTPTYISDYTVTENDVTAHQGALSITESQISNLQNYLTTEVDGSVTNEIELPAGGNNGQVLKTDGNGNYAWVNQMTSTPLDESDVDAFVANNGYLTAETQNLQQVLTQNNSANNQKITNLAAPTNNKDAVNKAYVDALEAKVNQLEEALINAGIEPGKFTDARDGNAYKFTTIGNQVWMAENLKYLPSINIPTDGSSVSSKYYVYDYSGTNVSAAKATTNYQTYGVLYNWTASQDACPAGWHLPSDDEWTALTDYLEGNPGAKLKETGTTHWLSPNTGATNETEFTALPGGLRGGNGAFSDITKLGNWWSATSFMGGPEAWYRKILNYNSFVYGLDINKDHGFSVRCLKD